VTVPRIRVGIWGVFGRGNFGNEATLAAFLDRLDPERYEPVLFCEDPEVASALHGVPARSLGRPADARGSRLTRIVSTAANRLRLLRGSIDAARSVDVVVVAGTGGLERYGSGAFGTPFEIWALGRGSRIARRPFLLVDIGVETLPRRLARSFVRGAGRSADYRSYRDASSRASMVASGLRSAASDPVVTDLAFALRLERAPLAAEPTVALGVMDYWGRESSHETGEEVHARYEARCVELVREFQSRGWRVRLIGGDDGDLEFAHRLATTLADDTPVIEARTPQELVTEMSAAHVVIASRYHTLIMALLAGTPAVSIGYADKHRSMLLQLGLPDEHRDIETFDAVDVAATAAALADRRPELTGQIDEAVAAARGRLDAQAPIVESAMIPGRAAS
jgi:polysaccharide pyruvyl transferase WcaK-like protein